METKEIVESGIITPVKQDSKVRTNGLNEEQLKAMLALAGRFKDDPEFVERLAEGAREARRRINEEALRELNEEDK